MDQQSAIYEEAKRDFRRARQRGALESVLAQFMGKSPRLLPYGEVSEQLHVGEATPRGLKEIPLDAIVGSVGRYGDFTRNFLPLRSTGQERWARVRAAFDSVEQMPPIVVYRLGDSYFVLDGNHRVSVARTLGATHIPAYVTDVESRVPLDPDTQPDELICNAKYAEFLQETKLDELRPDADLSVTAPGQYRVLKEQIQQYWAWLKSEKGEDVPYSEAVTGWYDQIYLPMVEIIRRRALLRHFPKRTETDLYAWLVRHREELKEALGWDVDEGSVARDLIDRFSPQSHRVLARIKDRLLEIVTPPMLEAGPMPGYWREEVLGEDHEDNLFMCVLASIDGDEAGWRALEQAIVVAQREKARIYGLHVVPPGKTLSRGAQETMQNEFNERCAAAGVRAGFSLERGRVAETIIRRAYWSDLVVTALSHPPGPRATDRLSSGFSALIRRSGRPVLASPCPASSLDRPLLAYDGSPKAREALFIAAYLAGKWQLPLTVLSVATGEEGEHDASAALTDARQYLQSRHVNAFYRVERGKVPDVMQHVAEEQESDFIIMGGYGFRPLFDVMLGSAVNDVLRWRRWPVLICR